MSDVDNFGADVMWAGEPGRIVGVMSRPSYIVELADGRRVTVAQDLVTVTSEGRPSEPEQPRRVSLPVDRPRHESHMAKSGVGSLAAVCVACDEPVQFDHERRVWGHDL